jgi:uncharacterized membrane protein
MENYNRTTLKNLAKEKIKGKVLNLFLAELVVLALTGAANGIPGLGQLVSIAMLVLTIGLSVFYLKFLDNGTMDYMDLFYSFSFKDLNKYLNHLATMLVKMLLIFLWSLLFIIPGIVKAIAYSQAEYIKAENPDIDIMDTLKESERLMKGHKMEYFVLCLSFIGWWFLVVITFFLAGIYVMPYYSTTKALFYRNLVPKIKIEAVDGSAVL